MGKILHTGFVGEEKNRPYVLLDVEQYDNKEDCHNSLVSMTNGGVLKRESFSQSDNIKVFDVPNIWKGPDFNPVSNVGLSGDAGLTILYVDGIDNSKPYKDIDPNGYFDIVPRYTKTYAPSKGAIVINTTLSSSDVSLRGVRTEYMDGSVIFEYHRGNESIVDSLLFDAYGNVYFYHTNTSISSALVGYINSGSYTYNEIGAGILPYHIYCLRPSLVSIEGTVYDAANMPAPNFEVVVFHRESKRTLGSTMSGVDGRYKIQCSANKGDELFMVCLDSDGKTPNFPAQVYDRITI